MENNYLQLTGERHCITCHTDYIDGVHTCGGSSTVVWCKKCQDIHWSYCPYCGKKLCNLSGITNRPE